MKRSTSKILTTHVGSLPELESLDRTAADHPQRLAQQIAAVVERQHEIGLDLINDGEYAKGGDWLAYIEERRGYWAAQCANSALILRDSGKPLGPLWQDFAVIGKHFAGSEPVADNPLAQVMAQRTAEAHESQRY